MGKRKKGCTDVYTKRRQEPGDAQVKLTEVLRNIAIAVYYVIKAITEFFLK